MSGAADLSGAWDGIYNYPRTLPATAFTATLTESGGILSGEISETSQEGGDRGTTIHALVEGTRNGPAIRFVKTYDDLRRARSPIVYEGVANGDGTEITGTWTIPGVWSGTFIMVRHATVSESVERLAAEPVG